MEALLEAYELYNEIRLIDVAEEVFSLHPFDSTGVWKELNIDGTVRGVCETFNQQLWFAIIGSKILKHRKNEEIKLNVGAFLEGMSSHFGIYLNGIIKHTFKSIKDPYKMLIHIRRLNSSRGRKLALGYHSFNLYGFAMLKEMGYEIEFWKDIRFLRALNAIETKRYKGQLLNNEFGFGYNVSGIEVAYVLKVFRPDCVELQKCWVEKQLYLNYDFEKHLLCKNSLDPITLSARIYEAINLDNLELSL